MCTRAYANPAILPFGHNIGGGLTWTGPLDARSNDIQGVGVQAVHFSADFHPSSDFEVNYEVSGKSEFRGIGLTS